jgi:hypothetical protein
MLGEWTRKSKSEVRVLLAEVRDLISPTRRFESDLFNLEFLEPACALAAAGT